MVRQASRRHIYTEKKFYTLFPHNHLNPDLGSTFADIDDLKAKMRRPIAFLLAIFLVALSILTGIFAMENNKNPIVRVCVIDDKDSVYLALKGRYKICSMTPERVIMEGPYFKGTVGSVGGGIRIGNSQIKFGGVKVKVLRDSNIYVDGKRFRGDVDIIKKENGKLMVINHVALEEYLYGVLYQEVSHCWPLEALKAQAIVARTFAVYQISQSRLQPYDLRSDVYSQVYGGRTSERWATNRAVDLTKGKVLTYGAQIFPTYYHATCAGYTEDAANLWAIDLAPLKGVPCDYCKGSPHYKWKKEIPMSALESKLKENNYKIGKISTVTLLSRNRSGRVDKLEIKDSSAVSVILTGKDFRQMMGPNDIRSTKFDADVKPEKLILNGVGWGHGAGMCQWGAYGMAKKHKKVEDILKYYYPEAKVASIDKRGG